MPKIKKIYDNIVIIEGAYNYKQGMLFDLAPDVQGYLISAKKDEASLLIIGDPSTITKKIKNIKPSTKSLSEFKIYSNFFESIISPFGDILESNNKKAGKLLGNGHMESQSPDILDRVQLTNPLATGMISIDTMIPIGQGQRELIIGDRSTGKTTIAVNAIINQVGKNVKSIYVSVGQKRSSVIKIFKTLVKNNAHKNAIIIFASPDSAAEQYFAPRIGMGIAEHFAYKGDDVLLIVDDLTKHANIYREISLSIERNPGREAYPTDIFYEHARLLERSGRFNEKYKNGSITCLPIVETVQGDVASTIPSNVISITDGQIFTSTQMANNNEYPAIDIGLSVSRTGSGVQNKKIKEISKGLKSHYLELFDVKKFADMSIDISESLQKRIMNWYGINNLLIQHGHIGYNPTQMQVLIEMFKMGLLQKIKYKNKFSIAFSNYCKKDKAAIKLIKMLEEEKFRDKKHMQDSINIVFGPFAKAASGIKGSMISEEEFNELKGGL